MTAPPRLSRAALIARIARDPASVIVIEAPAGTGKSWLLRDIAAGAAIWTAAGTPTQGHAVWDIPAVAQSDALPDRPGRIVLAKRPETAVPGLARAEVYGRVSRYRGDDLLFSPSEIGPALHAATGGWACLIPAAAGRDRAMAAADRAMVDFLRDDILRPLPSVQLVALELLLSGKGQRLAAETLRGLPFVTDATHPLPAPLAAARPHLDHALADLLRDRATDPVQARAIATAHAGFGQIPQALAIFQSIGAWQAALDTLKSAGGPFYIHRFGPEAFDRMLAGFPPDLAADEEMLVLCRAVQAVKRGEVPLTRRILIDRYGPLAEESFEVIGRRDLFSLDFRFIRLLLQTWEDFDIHPRYLELAYRLLAELGAPDDLRRGSFYNAVLEFYMRARRFPEAEDTAIRAANHFERADIPILSFYIDLHRGVIHLMTGNPAAAAKRADAAAVHLARAGYDSPGDARILAMLRACIAFEQGEAEPLTRFLSLDLDSFAQGEIWPSMIELILIYGSQAQSEHFSVMAARGFLDRWRVTEARSAQFGTMIDIREITLLQSANRWQEALARAAALPLPITQSFVEGAGEGLATLSDRDEVALALVWLRHLAQHDPGRAGLDRLLGHMADNPHLTHRQRVGVELWSARTLRRQRRLAEAEARLRQTLETVARLGTVASLGEERAFLAELTGTRKLRESLARSDAIRRILRHVADSGPGRARRGQAHGLSRQETRILNALAEGATNKAIANLMGLSEATVKFHLGNLYRKLGCNTRREAVAAAQALRLVA
ncbi:MAG: LuxR family transcriptional regulator [Rubellimicrobium sp.]|nr:LuxR family transcriptional regulator [Rubellimicrobium sp.]